MGRIRCTATNDRLVVTQTSTSLTCTTRRGYSRTLSFYDAETGGNPVAIKCGFDCNRRAVIYSDAPGTFWMECSVLSTQNGNGNWVNGAMVNAYSFNGASQGWDEQMAEPYSGGGGQVGAPVPYDDALNINKGRISISQGDEGTYSFAVANPSPNVLNGDCVLEVIEFTVMASVPDRNFFVAPNLYTSKSPIKYIDDIDRSCLRGLPKPSTDFFTEQDLDHPHFLAELASMQDNGERRNRLAAGTDDYSREWVEYRAIPQYYMHYEDADPVVRESWIREWIGHAIHFYGALDITGYSGASGAGQHFGRGMYLYMAAYLLNDQAMLDAADAHTSQDFLGVNQMYVVREEQTLLAADEKINIWPNSNGSFPMEFRQEHVGMFHFEGDGEGAELHNRYAGFLPAGYMRASLPAHLLQNGPRSKMLNQHLTERDGDTTADLTNVNYRFHVGLHAGFAQRRPAAGGYAPSTVSHWEAWKDSLHHPAVTNLPPWTPEVYRSSDVNAEVADTANGFTFDTSNYYSQLSVVALTQVDAAYSIDGRQLVVVPDVTPSGQEVTLPCKADTFVGLRYTNVNGSSQWSMMRPSGPGYSANPIVNKTGTESNSAPTFSTAPKILAKNVHETWPGNSFYEVTDLTDVVRIYCGAGYPTGFPAPVWPDDYTVTPILDGVSQTALMSAADSYELPASSSAQTIKFNVSITTTEGTVASDTNELTIPATNPLPAGTLIDYQGRGRDYRDNFTFFSNVGDGGTGALLPFDPLVRIGNGGTNYLGPVVFDFDSIANPSMLPLRGWPVTAGTTYRIEATIFAGSRVDDFEYYLEDASDGADLVPVETVANTETFMTYTRDYTPVSNIDLTFRVRALTGGTPAKEIYLVRFKLSEV